MIKFKIDCVTETDGQRTVYVQAYDDAGPGVPLETYSLKYVDKEQFKADLAVKLKALKDRISALDALRAEVDQALLELGVK